MAESIIQPDMDRIEELSPSSPLTLPSSSTIIWTPRFIVIFALTLTIGLSMGSLLTRGWLNGLYAPEWVLLAHITVVLGCWIALTIFARSPWVRIAAIFGSIWAVFTGMSFILSLLSVDPSSAIVAQLNAATIVALLGAYMCLSIDHIPFHRWDSWFFRLAPILAGCAVAAAYFFLPSEAHHLKKLEGMIAAAALLLCIFIWWIRPSCWRSKPCPTFFFGAAPVILLILSIPNIANGEENLFFSQVVLLCMLLGIMRTLQGELRQPTEPVPAPLQKRVRSQSVAAGP